MSSPASRAARVLVGELAAHGFTTFVLAPGSRSAPLAMALAEAAGPDRPPGAPTVDLHVRVDERSAAFLGLGLALAGRGVAVVTTSGTATANLHPAVLEAHHAGVPLLLLTADRPHELRGTGANQTTDQVGLYGTATRLAVDVPAPVGRPGEDADLRALVSRVVDAARGDRSGNPGPVHVNLAYRAPLVAAEGWPATGTAGRVSVPAARPGDIAAPLPPPATVVVAGAGAGDVARRLAEARGWPLLAEPSSGARSGPTAVPAYRLLLDEARPARTAASDRAPDRRVEHVVVLGRPTLSRSVHALLAGSEVTVVAPRSGPWADATLRAATVLPAVPAAWLEPGPDAVVADGTGGATVDDGMGGAEVADGTGGATVDGGMAGAVADDGSVGGAAVDRARRPGEWLAGWLDAGTKARRAIDEVLDAHPPAPWTGPDLARAVAAAASPQDVLVLGSSNPVRDLDLVADWSASPTIYANRGLAGIDGMIATATGIALGSGRPVRALLGDLTFLHDVGGLLRGSLEAEPDLQIVVAHDDGGSIFAGLEQGAPEHGAVFERVFGIPHGTDLGALCTGYGVPHRRVTSPAELDAALADPPAGLSVIEVPVDRSGRRALEAELAAAVTAATAPAPTR